MDKKIKILKFTFWSLIVLSTCFTFYKTIIKQDFVIIDYSEDLEEDEYIEDIILNESFEIIEEDSEQAEVE